MSIFNVNELRNNLQKYLQVRFQNYRLEGEQRLMAVIVAFIITFILLITLGFIFLFLNIAIAHALNELYNNDYVGYLIIVAVHTIGFVLLLMLMTWKKARNTLYSLLAKIIRPFFNFILTKILKQSKKEYKQHQTEIQNILNNKKLNRKEKQKQLGYIEDRYEAELGKNLKSIQKNITNTLITSAVSYVSFRLVKKVFFPKKAKKQIVVVNKPKPKTPSNNSPIMQFVKKKATNMAINTIVSTLSKQIEKGIQNQIRKNNRNED